jgi:phospholipase C
MPALGGIEHVIVLMLENRSFDSMLGQLRAPGPDFEGLPAGAANPYLGAPVRAWSSVAMDDHAATIPDPDPRELFADMSQQIFGPAPRGPGIPAMTGFVENYMLPWKGKAHDALAVMHCYKREHLPVLTQLADSFAVCDQWHASAPCQTWPNRYFAHTGTCLGYANNSEFPIPFPAPSIFGRLSQLGRSWRVYFHDLPQSIMLADVWWRAPLHYRPFGQFIADAHAGRLPTYSFIEPRYFTDLGLGIPNDQHPPSSVLTGEKLVADVYNAVRGSPLWKKSLLIITHDEHGGCYDHVPPPAAVSPDGYVHAASGFAFDAYGVRVPAVIVSPYVAPGTVIRSPGPHPFDHTSILATLRTLFGLGNPLTARDAAAPDLVGALGLAVPTNDGPLSIDPAPTQVPFDELHAAALAQVGAHQALLSQAARLLPPRPLGTDDALPEPRSIADTGGPNIVQAAGLDAIARVRSFLRL